MTELVKNPSKPEKFSSCCFEAAQHLGADWYKCLKCGKNFKREMLVNFRRQEKLDEYTIKKVRQVNKTMTGMILELEQKTTDLRAMIFNNDQMIKRVRGDLRKTVKVK